MLPVRQKISTVNTFKTNNHIVNNDIIIGYKIHE